MVEAASHKVGQSLNSEKPCLSCATLLLIQEMGFLNIGGPEEQASYLTPSDSYTCTATVPAESWKAEAKERQWWPRHFVRGGHIPINSIDSKGRDQDQAQSPAMYVKTKGQEIGTMLQTEIWQG